MSVSETKKIFDMDIAMCRKEPRGEYLCGDSRLCLLDEYWYPCY